MAVCMNARHCVPALAPSCILFIIFQLKMEVLKQNVGDGNRPVSQSECRSDEPQIKGNFSGNLMLGKGQLWEEDFTELHLVGPLYRKSWKPSE